MLRAIALALLLANAVYFAWGQGLLAAYGLAPARQSEPERLAQQLRPEALRIAVSGTPPPSAAASPVLPQSPASASASASAPTPAAGVACLQVGVFTEAQARLLRPRLQDGLPEGSWSFDSSGGSVRWIVYMGKYVSRSAMDRKREVLEQLGLPFEPPLSPLLNPGLSLGSFASRAEAEEALARMSQRGLRSARVVLERPEQPSLWLRLPRADTAMRAKLDLLSPQLAGKAIQLCP